MGRFAPSPTGPLHLGSLVAAVASFVDARAHGGAWRVRVDDIERCEAKRRVYDDSAPAVLDTLAAHGLEWDGAVEYQSRRADLEAYEHAMTLLRRRGRVFFCDCSRKRLARLRREGDDGAAVYPGLCRAKVDAEAVGYRPARGKAPATHAERFAVDLHGEARFEDRVMGPQRVRLADVGDFVVRRRDGVFAYQLSTVVDDARMGVSSVVRGADLLVESTAWQLALYEALGLDAPCYAHVPLLFDPETGEKLSKSAHSEGVDDTRAAANLRHALQLLGQPLPPDDASPTELLAYAVSNWRVELCRRAEPEPEPEAEGRDGDERLPGGPPSARPRAGAAAAT